MRHNSILAAAAVVFMVALAPQAQAQAQAGISLAIEKHARLTEQGGIVIRIHIICGPFEGIEDFQEAHAGAHQVKSGAEAESGIDGTVVCDGVERTYTAHFSSFTDQPFEPGPAGANASLFVCMLVGDEQMCFQGATSRRVIIRGQTTP